MPAPARPAFFLLLILVPCFLGCAGWSSCAHTREEAEALDVPADFAMTFGQGGGFAGLWSGYVVHGDGTVERWEGPVTREDTSEVGLLTSEEVGALWQQVHEADYFAQERTESGNMTSFIEVTANGNTHRTSWATRVEKTTPPASPLEKLYDYSRLLAQRAAGL